MEIFAWSHTDVKKIPVIIAFEYTDDTNPIMSRDGEIFIHGYIQAVAIYRVKNNLYDQKMDVYYCDEDLDIKTIAFGDEEDRVHPERFVYHLVTHEELQEKYTEIIAKYLTAHVEHRLKLK